MRYFQFKGPGAGIIGVEGEAVEAYEKSPANFAEVFPDIAELKKPKKKMGRPKKHEEKEEGSEVRSEDDGVVQEGESTLGE